MPTVTAPSTLMRPPDVILQGAMRDSSFEQQQWLVQRGAQFIQLTELLYRVLEQADGRKSLDDIATAVTETSEWLVTAEDVERLARERLIPARLAALVDSGADAPVPAPGATETPSTFDVRMRAKVIPQRFIQPVTAVLQHLFRPLLVLLLLSAAAATHVWAYLTTDVSASIATALFTPGGLLVSLAVLMVGGLIHEFGHAAALRYGGGEVRGIGVGLYLIFPAFYTDVTDGYRLGRAARVRTDLGGVYLHALFASTLMIVAAATGNQLLFFAALLVDVDIARQFIPFVRLDGYWLLADLTGVPDLFSQIGPFVRSLKRTRASGSNVLPQLKPWARNIFIAYIVLTIPALAYLMWLMISKSPALFLAARDAFTEQIAIVLANESVATSFLAVTQMALVAIPVVGSALIAMTLLALPLAPVAARMSGTSRRLAGQVSFASATALVLIWLTGTTGAQVSPAEAAITQARDALAAVHTLEADLEGIVGEDRYTGTLSLQRPNLARVTIDGSEGLGRFQVTSDGKDMLVYFPTLNQVSRARPGSDGKQITAYVVAHVRHFFNPDMLAQSGDHVEAALEGEVMHDGAAYRLIAVHNRKSQRVARYFISATDGLVHRIEYGDAGGEAAKEFVQLRNVRVNGNVPRDRFAWQPPRDATPLQMPEGVDLSVGLNER